MNRLCCRIAGVVLVCSVLVVSVASEADDWTSPVELTHNQARCISFRARLSGSYLAVEATPAPGWHTFAMDNARRATEKLAGKKPLSQDLPTQITVSGGLAVDGPWFQTPPMDFSRPALRWYSWGFEHRALFVAKVRRAGGDVAAVGIHGQVCTDQICKKVDVAISLPLATAATNEVPPDSDMKSLIQVR